MSYSGIPQQDTKDGYEVHKVPSIEIDDETNKELHKLGYVTKEIGGYKFTFKRFPPFEG